MKFVRPPLRAHLHNVVMQVCWCGNYGTRTDDMKHVVGIIVEIECEAHICGLYGLDLVVVDEQVSSALLFALVEPA